MRPQRRPWRRCTGTPSRRRRTECTTRAERIQHTERAERAERAARAAARSHPAVVRPAAALGRDPDDVLRRILDVAGLAVHAVLRVDLQARLRIKVDELVHPGGAVAAFGTGVLVPVDLHWNGRIL